MSVFNKLKKQIDSKISLDKEEWTILLDNLEVLEIKKGEYLLKEGQVCNFISFINKGALVYFKNLDNGDEVTTDFALENYWVADNYSRLNNSPSSINIRAIESTELFLLGNEKLNNLYERIPKLEKLGRLLSEQVFVQYIQQVMDLQTLSAKDRYLKLLATNKNIFQRIPQYHIANYLGIAPKSLSRLRNTIFMKE